MEVVGNADSTVQGRQVTKGDWGPPEASGDRFPAEDKVPRRRPHLPFYGDLGL